MLRTLRIWISNNALSKSIASGTIKALIKRPHKGLLKEPKLAIFLRMPNVIVSYFRESYEELKKVVWPTKRETTQHTLIVIGLSLALALFLGALDYGLSWGLEYVLQRIY